MMAQPPYSFATWRLSCTERRRSSWRNPFCSFPSAITQDFKATLWTIFFSSGDLDFDTRIFLGIWPCCLKISMLADGEELTVKTTQKLRERFPNTRIINALRPNGEATVACGSSNRSEMLLTS